jgi:DNA topoisomerase-2
MPPKYEKKDPREHMLDRPDMYVGSIKAKKEYEFVADPEFKISKKEVMYSPAILRIFIEPISNIIDNVARSLKDGNKVTKILINISPETGETTFWNDGNIIPIEKHDEGCYNHTLIFGHFLTSSNYDDTQDRLDISGRNGIGIKCSNVFSSSFTVEGVDDQRGLFFFQTWTENMKNVGQPVLKKVGKKKGYTKISFIPDFKRFGLNNYTEDILSVYRKYMIDMAMLTKVKVYFNDVLIPVSNMLDYAKMYGETEEILSIKTDSCEVVLTSSEIEYECISFANGVCTSLGGVHVDAWTEAFFRPIVDKLNKPNQPSINIKDVKNCFRIFVNASVVNPVFESQSKLRLEEPKITADVKPTHITKIMKWSCIERLREVIESKSLSTLKNIERKKRGYVKIENLEPANNEGGKKGHECILILVEGDSAKCYANYGISEGVYDKKGHDWFGIYKLRGKLLNCRNSTPETISANKVVDDIIKCLNLRIDVDYTKDENYKTLRYGKLMILTDADVDGIHISSLVQNMIHYLFPSLLQRDTPFVVGMQTPIVGVTIGKKKEILFYDEVKFREWVKNNPNKNIKPKYYKGLGTSDAKMAKRTFGVKMIEFESDEKLSDIMNKVFHKKHADERKKWLEEYDPKNNKIEWDGDAEEKLRVKISDFLDTELIKFSLRDCARSIPALMDGFKESQRKILYAGFMKKIDFDKPENKVAQFGAYVAEKTNYHHGEQNLFETIIKMAQTFVGVNNIPLFMRNGAFGSRAKLGQDSASPRYIHTNLEELSRYIFKSSDEELLEYVESDGERLEPVYYVPILPMILVNGCIAGIGTGWSCNIPCFNPLDIIKAIKVWIENDGDVLSRDDEGVLSSKLEELVPWYRGFTGSIIPKEEGKYITTGVIKPDKAGTRIVEELPIGLATEDFLSHLEDLKANGTIKDYKNYCGPNKIKVVLHETTPLSNKDLKLVSTVSLTNMVLFNENNKIERFDSVDEIIDRFCKVRLPLYTKRKANMMKNMEAELTLLGNKKRFLMDVLRGDIKLFGEESGIKAPREKEDIVKELDEKKYDRINGEYEYLLALQIRSMTLENINKITNDYDSIHTSYQSLKEKTDKQLWLYDLDEFEKVYNKFLVNVTKELSE